MEDLQLIRRVDTPSNCGAGMVVVARVVTSIVEGDEMRHIRCDLTKLNGALYRIWCGVNRLGDSGVKVA